MLYKSEEVRNTPVWKTRKFWIFAILLSVSLLFVAPVVRYLITDNTVSGNPNACPPGQEKTNGCKWVQHRNPADPSKYGKCQWLPADSVASPWVEVPENTCPKLLPAPTNTLFVAPSATFTGVPPTATNIFSTCTPTITVKATDGKTLTPEKSVTPDNTAVPERSATNIPDNKITPSMTIQPTCDLCAAQATNASALATLAHNDTIRLQTQISK